MVFKKCENNKVINVKITNLPSFVLALDKKIYVEGIGKIIVSTAYGGDSFVLVQNKDIKVNIEPKNAYQIVNLCSKITKAANNQIGFSHPLLPELNYISFCIF